MSGRSPTARALGSATAGRGDPVIDRAFALHGSFQPTRRALSLSDLARRAGLPTSTALRLTRRLVDLGALERRGNEYVIGVRLWEIASLAPRGMGLREAAMPVMGDLAEATQQHVLLAVREGKEAVLVERLSGRAAIPVLYRIGGRLPLHSTGVGLVLLAFSSPEFQESLLDEPLIHLPERVPVDRPALRRRLAAVRQEEVAVVHRNEPEPLVAVAAPILGEDDEVVAALSVIVPPGGMDPARIAPAIRTAARAISRALGAPRARRMPAAASDDVP